MIRRPPRSTQSRSSAASDVYKRQAYGTFVRIIEHYVKELKFYTLEDAIHRSTGLSASRYGLEDRGVIKPGAAADLVVFDLEKTHDNSTYDDPEQYPDGIEYVSYTHLRAHETRHD